jgi:hypothetical protein
MIAAIRSCRDLNRMGPQKRRYRNAGYVGARRANMERYIVAKLCRDDLESSGGGDGVEVQGEVRKASGPVAGPRRVGLRRTGLQAQVSDFCSAPRCVAASLVTEA